MKIKSHLHSMQSTLGGNVWEWVGMGSGRLGVGIGSRRAVMRDAGSDGWERFSLGCSDGSSGSQLQIMGVV